jgi:hypothetical protein
MSGKYDKLTKHLESVQTDPWSMTFDQIEAVIGSKLPPSARKYNAWWANSGKAQSQAWMRIGFRTAVVLVEEQRLLFTRRVDLLPVEEDNGFFGVQALSISEAKAGLAKKFGVPMDNIEIIIKG